MENGDARRNKHRNTDGVVVMLNLASLFEPQTVLVKGGRIIRGSAMSGSKDPVDVSDKPIVKQKGHNEARLHMYKEKRKALVSAVFALVPKTKAMTTHQISDIAPCSRTTVQGILKELLLTDKVVRSRIKTSNGVMEYYWRQK